MEKVKGLIVAPFTAFTAEGEVDLPKVRQQKDFYKSNGAAGAFICGTTGEGAALQKEEKVELFREWSKYKDEDFAVIAFCGGTCVRESAELAKAAQDCGLDAVAITAPYYQRPRTLIDLCECCSSVARAVPQMPLYYYHVPTITGVNFPMHEFLKKADEFIPNFAGIKYTDQNIMDFQLCLNHADGKYNIMWGWDEMMLSAMAVGAEAFVGSTYGYLAPTYIKVIQLFKENRHKEAAEHQLAAVKFVTLLGKYGSGCGKAYMKVAGLDLGPCRPPLSTMGDEQYEQFLKELDTLEFGKYKSTL
ncbi:MAG: dihydrodipicolinate synthase family protein [Bacteroidales bacterium]|nr:dihydrodipicolinate synthase family protein [Bacteroidales bacterium]